MIARLTLVNEGHRDVTPTIASLFQGRTATLQKAGQQRSVVINVGALEAFVSSQSQGVQIPLSGAVWAAKSEAYACLVAEHLSPHAVWLDAGCGSRLLEGNMDQLEDWLALHCKSLLGMDLAVTANRNINSVFRGSLYGMPFPDNSLDLITCRMVVEHLDRPRKAFNEAARCLRPGGALIVMTPNLLNYGIFGNAVASKVMPEKLRLRIVHASDSRAEEDIFPVRYKANTMHRLAHLLNTSGLQVHKTRCLRQQQPYWRKHPSFEKLLMMLTPVYVLLACAHKT
jgi:SAM-dependent methyltransferase